MQRVLANLLSNALKFTDDGGEVAVCGDKFEDVYILEVKDTGSGISEKERKQLFERFSQGSSGRKHQSGTGLGLYLSRQIVERHPALSLANLKLVLVPFLEYACRSGKTFNKRVFEFRQPE